MDEQKYRITFKGDILPNANLEEVKQNLAALYKMDVKEIQHLFSGKSFTLKEGIGLDSAQKLMYQFEQAGALCHLVKMGTEDKNGTMATLDKTPPAPAVEQAVIREKQAQHELHYRLIFKGEILPDKNINEVKTNLSMFYRVKPDKLEGLFAGKPVPITKEPTDFWTVASYINRFKECGAVCYLEAVESTAAVEEAPGKYKIVFNGDLQEGYDVLTVKTKLASMFKVSGLMVDKLFLGKAVLVRTDLSADSAQSFKASFEKTGAGCQMLKISETPRPPAPKVSNKKTGSAAAGRSRISPQPAPRQITLRQPPPPRKKSNALTILILIGIVFVAFIIFKSTSNQSSVETEPTSATSTALPPPQPRAPVQQPQPRTQPPAPSGLLSDQTNTFKDPANYYSVSLPEGYVIINESKGSQSKILFNYSLNINVTIIASPTKEKWDPDKAMFEKVSAIEDGSAGPLSRLLVISYELVEFNDLNGYLITLEEGNQRVHVYEMVSPTQVFFSITIVAIGDSNQENLDILDSAIRSSLEYPEQSPDDALGTSDQAPTTSKEPS